MKHSIILLSDSSRGIHIPRHFAEEIKRECLRDKSRAIADLDDLLDWFEDVDPHDSEGYWDEWQRLLDNLTVEIGGHSYQLHHEGDLWLYCEELMTEQEKRDFLGDF